MSDTDLILRLAIELDRMNDRHGCGQIECSLAMNVVRDARERLGLRRAEPFPEPTNPYGSSAEPADSRHQRQY